MQKALIKMRNNKKGFTLVEVIVVLVILAILAAVLIPSLTGYIDKANEKVAIAECRSAVMAAQTLASEQYGEKKTAPAVTDTDIQKLAEVTGTSTITWNSFKVATLTYVSTNGYTVTYSNGAYKTAKTA